MKQCGSVYLNVDAIVVVVAVLAVVVVVAAAVVACFYDAAALVDILHFMNTIINSIHKMYARRIRSN